MAFVLADRVKETTTTTGTGTLTLAGAATGYQSFAVIGTGNTTYYAIIDSTNNVWETGLGTYTSAGTTLARTTVFANSSGTTTQLTLAAGTKDVICTQVANTANTSDITILGGNGAGKQAPAGTTAIGSAALAGASFSAINTTAVGKGALTGSVSGSGNTALGYNAGANVNTGTNNTIMGSGAGISVQGGGSNTLIGQNAGGSISANTGTVAIGVQAATGMSGAANTCVGNNTGLSSTGGNNVLFGYAAGSAAMSGNAAQNCYIGYAAGTNCTSTFYNTVLGGFSGSITGALAFDMTTTNNNVAISDGQGNLKAFWSGFLGMNAHAVAQRATASATSATGTIAFYTQDQQILYYTSNSSAAFTLNVRGSSGTTLNAAMSVGQSVTVEFWNTNGASAFGLTAFQIDGTGVTPKWRSGGGTPGASTNAIDRWVFSILKTAANTYTVLGFKDNYA
jgi:hypothetical protein